MHRERAGAFAVEAGESTATVRERVAVGARRGRASGGSSTASGPTPRSAVSLLRRRFRLESKAMEPLKTALDRGVLSIRGVDRTLRVAWTLADLAGRTSPGLDDVTTALSFRQAGGAR